MHQSTYARALPMGPVLQDSNCSRASVGGSTYFSLHTRQNRSSFEKPVAIPPVCSCNVGLGCLVVVLFLTRKAFITGVDVVFPNVALGVFWQNFGSFSEVGSSLNSKLVVNLLSPWTCQVGLLKRFEVKMNGVRRLCLSHLQDSL